MFPASSVELTKMTRDINRTKTISLRCSSYSQMKRLVSLVFLIFNSISNLHFFLICRYFIDTVFFPKLIIQTLMRFSLYDDVWLGFYYFNSIWFSKSETFIHQLTMKHNFLWLGFLLFQFNMIFKKQNIYKSHP